MCDEWCYFGFAVFTVLIVIVTAAIHLIAWFPSLAYRVLYASESRANDVILGDGSFLDTDWMPWIWVSLYGYQMLLAAYTVSFIGRPPEVAALLRSVVSYKALSTFDLALGSLTAWTLLKGQDGPNPYFNCLTLFAACVFLCVSCSLVVTSLGENAAELDDFRCDVIMVRTWVVNGWSSLAAWTMVLCLYDATHGLFMNTSIDVTFAQFTWLGIVSGICLSLLLVSTFCTRRFLQYALSPYIVVGVAFTSVATNRSARDRIDDVTAYVIYGLIGFIAVLFVLAIAASARGARAYDYQKRESITFVRISLQDDTIPGGHVTK